jgi:hypothetical protein
MLGLPIEIVWFIAGGLLVGAVALAAWQWEKRRTAAVRTAARNLGWAEEKGDLPAGLDGLPLFGRGHSRRGEPVFAGSAGGGEALLVEYRFRTGHGRNSRTHRQTVLALHRPEAGLPDFELRPENLLHKVGAAFGWQDIDLDRRPEFSKAYLLRGPDEDAIRRLFGDGGITHHFERHRGWSVEAAGGWLIVYRARKRAKPDHLRDFVREAERVATVLTGR